MRLATRVVAVGVILGAIGGAFVGASHMATAQSQGGSTAPLRDVSVSTPDGGTLRVGIDDSVRLDVSATTPPGSYLAVAGDETGSVLRTEVTGPSGGPVIAELGQQTANLITNPACAFGVPQITTIGITPVRLPTLAESHVEPTTRWMLLNLSPSRRVCCQSLQADGGLPDCVTKGYVALPSGGTITLDGQQTENMWCRASATTAEVNVWESSCVQ